MDMLKEEEQDNVVIGRCNRRAALEAFWRVPNPVAEEQAEIKDKRSRSHLEEEKEDSRGEALVKGVRREATKAQEEEGIKEKYSRKLSPEQVKKWMAGEDIEDFEEDSMAFVRRRTRRVKQTTLGQEVRKGRGEGKAAMAANAAGLENVSYTRTSFVLTSFLYLVAY